MSIVVNVDNFARSETDRMMAAISARAGGINVVFHNRTFAPLEQQTVIRENRDTARSADRDPREPRHRSSSRP